MSDRIRTRPGCRAARRRRRLLEPDRRRGRPQLPRAETHVHCRNCPVFAAAARAFFDRPAPEGYLAEWTRGWPVRRPGRRRRRRDDPEASATGSAS